MCQSCIDLGLSCSMDCQSVELHWAHNLKEKFFFHFWSRASLIKISIHSFEKTLSHCETYQFVVISLKKIDKNLFLNFRHKEKRKSLIFLNSSHFILSHQTRYYKNIFFLVSADFEERLSNAQFCEGILGSFRLDCWSHQELSRNFMVNQFVYGWTKVPSLILKKLKIYLTSKPSYYDQGGLNLRSFDV